MDDLIYWIALSNVSGLGCYKSKILLEFFKTPEGIFQASPQELKSIKGIGPVILNSIKKKDSLFEFAEKELSLIKDKGLSIITLSHKSYPPYLKEISDPPVILYLKGKIIPEDKWGIAVIGTRNPDNYGKKMALKISESLARYNFTIISGMARGIDTIAHRGAIKSGGRTIAVLGCGIDVVYPPENLGLMSEIPLHGAVISEFPLGTVPAANNFPRRNRIISGLSRGVLVVQAKERSGTSYTVNSALEQGREVFAIPGPADRDLSRGANKLIKEGAKLVETVTDVIEELGPVENNKIIQFPLNNSEKTNSEKLKGDEEKVYLAVEGNFGGNYIDEIIKKTGMEPGKVNSILSLLEIKGFIKKERGNLFIRL